MLIIAAVLYIVALQFCNDKTIAIKHAYERQSILSVQNADVAQTILDATYLRFMILV